MNIRPSPKRPRTPSSVPNTAIAATRTTRSISQASARETGPASRRLSSMPSGVGTSRAVSSISTRSSITHAGDLPRAASGPDLLDEDVPVTGVDGSHEHRPEHEPAQQERDRGHDREQEGDHAVDQERK